MKTPQPSILSQYGAGQYNTAILQQSWVVELRLNVSSLHGVSGSGVSLVNNSVNNDLGGGWWWCNEWK